MTQETAELLKKALTLSLEERAEMAGSLLESLDEPEDDPALVEAAWDQEIARRVDDLDSGKASPVCLEEFRRKLIAAGE